MKGVGNIGTGVLIAGGLLAVAAFVLWWTVPPLRIKEEIDPLGLLQTGLTLIVGFFLTQHLANRTSEKKFEKELLIKHAQEASAAAAEASEALDIIEADIPVPPAQRRALVRKTKTLGERCSNFVDLLSLCLEKDEGSKHSQQAAVDEINGFLRKFRNGTGNDPISVLERTAALDATAALQRSLATLAIQINRVHG